MMMIVSIVMTVPKAVPAHDRLGGMHGCHELESAFSIVITKVTITITVETFVVTSVAVTHACFLLG